jgi:hypothetical protein
VKEYEWNTFSTDIEVEARITDVKISTLAGVGAGNQAEREKKGEDSSGHGRTSDGTPAILAVSTA